MENLKYAEISANDLGNRDIARKNSKLGEQVIYIATDKIVVRDGFNCRTEYGDITALANSIFENGQEVPGRVDVMKDGTFMLTDGHRRFKALTYINEVLSSTAFLFKAIVNDRQTTEEERILQMFTTQDNKQLEDIEVCELFNRLIKFGYKQADIVKKTGKDQNYVSRMLSLATENIQVKEHVKNGDISVSAVLALKKEIPKGSERTAAINKAVTEKKEKKQAAPVTASQVTGKDAKEDKAAKLAKLIIDRYMLLEGISADLINLIKENI